MTDNNGSGLTEARKKKWDSFLDAYSMYLGERNVTNAATLKLAGVDLEESDETFSMDEFADRLGWQEEVECQTT